MTFAQFLDRQIPHGSKPARGLGVADRALCHPDALEAIWRDGADDAGSVFGRHARTVPNLLAQVKPNDPLLPQVSWRATLQGMALEDTPYGDIAARLIWHRTLTGADQKNYAEKAGLKRSQYSNWETGLTRLSLDGGRALRQTYGLSLDFLFEGIDDALPMTLRMAWRDRPQVK